MQSKSPKNIVEFITKVSNMGDKKIIIIPKRYHKVLKKRNLSGTEVSITIKQIT